MRRITNVRLPAPLGGATEQRHWLDLNIEGVVTALGPMGSGISQAENNWNGDWISPRGNRSANQWRLGLGLP
jgi:N-acetylglucosamine-6-phosphate deacetylase